jgi:hypothetical protein
MFAEMHLKSTAPFYFSFEVFCYDLLFRSKSKKKKQQQQQEPDLEDTGADSLDPAPTTGGGNLALLARILPRLYICLHTEHHPDPTPLKKIFKS